MTSSPNFGSVAETYARLRPGYPPAVFDDLVALTGLAEGASILEIGPATGQATLPLAQRGYRITGIDTDAALVEEARKALAAFPNVQLHVSRFEDWQLPPVPFDLVLSATAFHWIDPAVRYVKAASALKRDGHLAVIHTYHIRGGTQAFFDEVQSCYDTYMLAETPPHELRDASAIAPSTAAYEASGLFTEARSRRYEWQETYDAATYTQLLATFSDHIALPEDTRTALLDCVASLITASYGGNITKQYLTELIVARKR
jgi:trans-aconitate methyltransferase